jgi:ribbon-helix-helix protein
MSNSATNHKNTRLTITWSKETDLALRSFLGAQGLKKGALSKFIEDAVKWSLFDQTITEVRAAFADVPPDQLQKMIDEAVQDVRRERRAQTER